jgi:hypothetical protein
MLSRAIRGSIPQTEINFGLSILAMLAQGATAAVNESSSQQPLGTQQSIIIYFHVSDMANTAQWPSFLPLKRRERLPIFTKRPRGSRLSKRRSWVDLLGGNPDVRRPLVHTLPPT